MLEKLTILVVEDEPDICELIVFTLQSGLKEKINRDVEIFFAYNGEEALSMIRQHPPTLILTDIRMPIMTGFGLIENVKSHDELRHIPIVILSAVGKKEMRLEGLDIGADDYIIKPFDPDELIFRLKIRIRILDLEDDLRKALQEENRNLKSVIKTMQPVFISYSHSDIAYAQILATALRQNGLDVWFDERISHGDKWFQTIVSAIETCAAFTVIMTPEAEKSEWVHKEILLAKRANKKIYPLLLKGQEFAILIDTQFFNVQNYNFPGENFFTSISGQLKQESLE